MKRLKRQFPQGPVLQAECPSHKAAATPGKKTDIPILSQFFMERISKKLNKKSVNISEKTMKSFLEYEWPGNVRELENIIERIVNTESIPDSFMKTDSSVYEKAEENINELKQEATCEVIDESLES